MVTQINQSHKEKIMDKLIEAMKRLLADFSAFRIKAQYYHWNVEGPDFMQYHGLFSDLYTSADANIDDIAEHIRSLGAYAPGSLGRFLALTSIQDETIVPEAWEMINRIAQDNQKIHATLTICHTVANELNQRGVVNFLEGLLDANEKDQWKLRATLKR
jgi:starvation-inducible DNA-binding protein